MKVSTVFNNSLELALKQALNKQQPKECKHERNEILYKDRFGDGIEYKCKHCGEFFR